MWWTIQWKIKGNKPKLLLRTIEADTMEQGKEKFKQKIESKKGIQVEIVDAWEMKPMDVEDSLDWLKDKL